MHFRKEFSVSELQLIGPPTEGVQGLVGGPLNVSVRLRNPTTEEIAQGNLEDTVFCCAQETWEPNPKVTQVFHDLIELRVPKRHHGGHLADLGRVRRGEHLQTVGLDGDLEMRVGRGVRIEWLWPANPNSPALPVLTSRRLSGRSRYTTESMPSNPAGALGPAASPPAAGFESFPAFGWR
jgi:hypothetical protein